MAEVLFDMLKGSSGKDSFTHMPDELHRLEQPDYENVVILDPGDDRAQKMGRAMGSQMAGDILKAFEEGPMTLTALSENLAIPINTAKYHVENLVNADLLEIVNTKYSVKGRKVKIYGLKNQVVIVAPKGADVRSLLLKYASLFVIVIAGMFAVFAMISVLPLMGSSMDKSSLESGESFMAPDIAPEEVPAGSSPPSLEHVPTDSGLLPPELLIGLFLCCGLFILLLFVYMRRIKQ